MKGMVRTIAALAVALAACEGGGGSSGDPGSTARGLARCGEHPWCDTGLSPAERTALLLEAMTLEEKISVMAGDDFLGVVTRTPATGTSLGIPRLGIPTGRSARARATRPRTPRRPRSPRRSRVTSPSGPARRSRTK